MAKPSRALIGVSAAVLTVSLAACSSSSSGGSSTSPTASSTPSTAASTPSTTASTPSDTGYASLLIAASDVPLPGVKEGTPSSSANGARVEFTAPGGRSIDEAVVVYAAAKDAKAAVAQAVGGAKQGHPGAKVSSVPVGDGGSAIRGTSTDGGAVTILVFSDGRALVAMTFSSKANDPAPTSLVKQIAIAQDDKIKAADLG